MATPILNTPDVRMADLRSNRPDDSTANAILRLGEGALEADKQYATAKLDRELVSETQAYTNQTDVGAAGPQSIIQDPNYRSYGGVTIDAIENPQYIKALDNYQRKLKENASAHAQGKLSTVAFQARVEDITRNAIASRPGLRRELTAAAAATLGFDPTGSQLRSLMAQATADVQDSPWQKGLDETEQAMAKEYAIARARNPNGNDEEWRKQAIAVLDIDQQQRSMDDLIGTLEKQSKMSEADIASYVGAHTSKVTDAIAKLVYVSSPMAYTSQEAWDGAVAGARENIAKSIAEMRSKMEALPAWSNRYVQAKGLEELIKAEKEMTETVSVLSALRKSAVDAKTGSINNEILKLKFNAMMDIKRALKDYPMVWNALVTSNFSQITANAVTANMPFRAKVMDAFNVLGGITTTPTPSTAPGGRPTPAKPVVANDSLSNEIKMYFAGNPPDGRTENVLTHSAGAGAAAAEVLKNPPIEGAEEKSSEAYSKHINTALDGMLLSGGLVSIDGNTSVNFRPIEMDNSNLGFTKVEEAWHRVAKTIIDKPENLAYVSQKDYDTTMEYIHKGWLAYANMLGTNANRNVNGMSFMEKPVAGRGFASLKVTTDNGTPILQYVPNKAMEKSNPSGYKTATDSIKAMVQRYNSGAYALSSVIGKGDKTVLINSANKIAARWAPVGAR